MDEGEKVVIFFVTSSRSFPFLHVLRSKAVRVTFSVRVTLSAPFFAETWGKRGKAGAREEVREGPLLLCRLLLFSLVFLLFVFGGRDFLAADPHIYHGDGTAQK